jgi:hypothetical protein
MAQWNASGLTWSGSGNFKEWLMLNYGSAVAHPTSAQRSYSVNSDCKQYEWAWQPQNVWRVL